MVKFHTALLQNTIEVRSQMRMLYRMRFVHQDRGVRGLMGLSSECLFANTPLLFAPGRKLPFSLISEKKPANASALYCT